MPEYRYPWPASAISPGDMATLHAVRESSLPRVPITELIAAAIRDTYGQASIQLPTVVPIPVTTPESRKAA